jgi:phospholipase C
MDTRREFLKKAAMLSASMGFGGVLPPSIQKALAINPPLEAHTLTPNTW